MEAFLPDYTALKRSALSKLMIINNYADQVTIGPLSKIHNDTTKKIEAETVFKQSSPIKSLSKKYCLPKYERPNVQKEALAAIEKQRKQAELAAIEIHKHKLLDFKRQQQISRREQWKQEQDVKIQEINQQEFCILEAMQQVHDESLREQEKLLAQQHQRQLEQDRLIRQNLILQEQKQKRETLMQHITAFQTHANDIEQIFKSNAEAKHLFDHFQCELFTIQSKLKEIEQKWQHDEQDLNTCANLTKVGKTLKENLKAEIKKYYEQRQKGAEETISHYKQLNAEKHETKTIILKQPKIAPNNRKTKLEQFGELQIFLDEQRTSLQSLIDDDRLKSFRLDCKKAVNIPVNAISATNRAHLLDKYVKLNALLKGDVVMIGHCQVKASQHPFGVVFCMDLLARKFVTQGDLTISVNPEAAFAYATIIVSLWNDCPQFGKLLLANFYRQCPFLVPLQIQRTESQSDEEYYRSVGYKYEEGNVEKQDKFLKRMNGVARLYFAIMISHPGMGQQNHPFGLSNGWTWIASVLNQEPCVDVTSTLLHCFLSIAGNAMMQVYRRQFQKILRYLNNFMMPRLKEKDTGGPYGRLESLLQTFAKEGRFHMPDGFISRTFW